MSGINTNSPASYFEQEVVYLECRHNHASSLGGNSYDGCQEFMEGVGENNSSDSLLCVACGCHRNYHRKHIFYHPIICQPQTENPQTEIHVERAEMVPMAVMAMPVAPRKRKRTQFTAEQRSRMLELANKLGWRPQKSDKEEIERFCLEVGISRRTFQVWLCNIRRRVIMEDNATTSYNNN